jgi:putative ABC transport system permease protein
MTTLGHDLRYALRGLTKARGFAAIAILTLAFALGANTAIFSVVSAILLQPLPFQQPEELMHITGANMRWSGGPFSLPNYDDVRKQSKSWEHIAGYTTVNSFLYEGNEPERLEGAMVTANLFPMLGVKPHLGRTFTDREDQFGQPWAVVLSYELWQRRFGGDPNIIGRQVRMGADPDVVLGIMPRGFKFPVNAEQVDFYIPMYQHEGDPQGGAIQSRGGIWMDVLGRLKEGVTLQQANAELKTIAARLDKQYPDSNKGLTFSGEPLHDVLVRSVKPALLVLMAAVGVVLLIGCANVANLLLARAAVRHREISIRSAIGATRGRIIFQLLVESVLLAVVAGAIGLLLATWGVDLLVALAPAEIPRLDTVAVDRTVLLFTLVLSVLTGIIFGLAPALSASKTNLVEALKEGSRGSTEGRRRNRLRNALVVAEIALSVILLVGAGLLLRSFLRLSGVDPGYDYKNAISIDLVVRQSTYKTDAEVSQYHRRALEELSRIPGVVSAGGANHLPLGNNEEVYTFQIVGRPPFPQGQEPNATLNRITPNYFKTMGIPVLHGRPITELDHEKAPLAVVVSEAFVRKYFAKESPLGRQLDIGDGSDPRTIVGVVRDIRFTSLTEPPKPTFYVSSLQSAPRHMQFVVRAPNAATLGPSLRAAVKKLDREQPILQVRTLEDMRSESLAGRRFMLVLIGALATLALILAAVGIYSIMSYSVTQRTSEIGIRMSLGAEARDIFRLIVGHAVRLVVIGLVAGIIIALAATRVMTSLLYGITATDPATFVSICAVIGGIALLASYLPANRATRVDPLVAIRSE